MRFGLGRIIVFLGKSGVRVRIESGRRDGEGWRFFDFGFVDVVCGNVCVW